MATITGTRGADVLFGGSSGDDIDGLEGNDQLSGLGGADRLYGGAGQDILEGGEGNDRLYPWTGREGANANATIVQDDTVRGGEGFDTLVLPTSANLAIDLGLTTAQSVGLGRLTISGIEAVYAGSGHDTVRGTTNDEQFDGADGNDTLLGYGGDDHLNGGQGNDYLEGAQGVDRLDGGDGDDELVGGQDADALIGRDGDDRLSGGDGDDDLAGGSGADIIDGGAGSDLYSFGDITYVANPVPVVADLETGVATDQFGFVDLLTGVENLSGTHLRDTLRGDAQANWLRGYNEVDILEGRDGDDRLDGGTEDDTLNGGAGDDVLIGDLGNDAINGGDGMDTASYVPGESSLWHRVTRNESGSYSIQYFGYTDTLVDVEYAQFANQRVHLTATGPAVYGGGTGDSLFGTLSADTIEGFAGDDVINAGGGSDFVMGGDGDDAINGSWDADYLVGGAGADRFIWTSWEDSEVGAVVDVVADFESGVDRLAFTFDTQRVLISRSGDTSLVYFGWSEGEYAGLAQINGLVQGSDIEGYTGGVTLIGTTSSDVLIGSAGKDLIIGSGGADQMTGGSGGDRFVIRSQDSKALDEIMDFQTGVDRLEVPVEAAYLLRFTAVGDATRIDWLGGAVLVHGAISLSDIDFGPLVGGGADAEPEPLVLVGPDWTKPETDLLVLVGPDSLKPELEPLVLVGPDPVNPDPAVEPPVDHEIAWMDRGAAFSLASGGGGRPTDWLV